MSNETYEVTEEELEQIKQQASMGFGYPQAPERENVFKFFRHLIDKTDSSKIGNLSKNELGQSYLPVRGFQSIALYADKEGLDEVASFLRGEGEIVLSTSGSLKGFYPTLFITQIKREQKIKTDDQKKGWLSSNKQDEKKASDLT